MSLHPKIAALALAIVCALPGPATAQADFDGQWSVSASVDGGGCTGPYRYPIVIRDGIVDDPSGSGADASGRVADDGSLVGSIRSCLASIAVEGRLRSSAGSGSGRCDPPLVSRTPLIRSLRAGKVFDGEDETRVHPRVQTRGGGPAGK